jgi:hypothetical protein
MDLIFVMSDKGGVGKSFTSSILLETLIKQNRKPGLVDLDLARPDVESRYNADERVLTVRTRPGLSDVETLTDALTWVLDNGGEDRTVVINTNSNFSLQFATMLDEFGEVGQGLISVVNLISEPVDTVWRKHLATSLAEFPPSRVLTVIPKWVVEKQMPYDSTLDDIAKHYSSYPNTSVVILPAYQRRELLWTTQTNSILPFNDLIAKGMEPRKLFSNDYVLAVYLQKVIKQFLDTPLFTSGAELPVPETAESDLDEAF